MTNIKVCKSLIPMLSCRAFVKLIAISGFLVSTFYCTGKPSEPMTWAALGLLGDPDAPENGVGNGESGETVDPEPTASSDGLASCLNEEDAIFISYDNGSDSNSGDTSSNPVQSINYGLSLANPGDSLCLQSRAGNAPYDETGATLDIPSGVSLIGGFDTNWNHTENRTPIMGHRIALRYSNLNGDAELNTISIKATDPAQSSQNSMALRIVYGTANLTIQNTSLESGDILAAAPDDAESGSSYGIYAFELAQLEIIDSEVIAGKGGDGGAGSPGEPGEDGDPGDPGGTTPDCVTDTTGAPGGNGGTHPGIEALNGHKGGDGGDMVTSGNPGAASSGDGPCGGAPSESGNTPPPGSPATCNGDSGNAGDSAEDLVNGPGTMSDSYSPVSGLPGEDGEHGVPGSGGGGGAAHTCFTCNDAPGNGGGGGGAAGSGGEGGKPGAGGGGSFAIYANNTDLILTNTTLQAGSGGNGGASGEGGPGGSGGDAGSGSDNCGGYGAGGGDGGAGGDGGPGGDGSGGSGGPSIALVLVESAMDFDDLTLQAGDGGNGGASRNGRSGDGGHSYAIFASASGLIPELSDVTISVGNGGDPGAITGTGPSGNTGPATTQYSP